MGQAIIEVDLAVLEEMFNFTDGTKFIQILPTTDWRYRVVRILVQNAILPDVSSGGLPPVKACRVTSQANSFCRIVD